MADCKKIPYPTERAALDAKKVHKKFRGGQGRRDLKAYRCPECEGEVWHLGRSYRTAKEIAQQTRVSKSEVRLLRNRVEDVGRQIANEELKEARKKVRELAPIVAEDREWLRRMKDAAEFHEACAEALNKMLEEYWRTR
jgi:hypothetical protein